VVISTGVAAPPVLAFDEIVATPAPGFTPVRTDAEDAACLIYTSGTTGDPKGVLHAHRFLYGHLPCLELSLGWFPQPGDVGWTPADWAWIGGLMDMALPCLFYGVPLVSHRFAKFDPEAAMRLMAEEGVSAAFIPPTALRMMRHAAVAKGLRLRAIGSGGEALGPDLLDWGRARSAHRSTSSTARPNATSWSPRSTGSWTGFPARWACRCRATRSPSWGRTTVPVGAGEVGEVCVRAPDPVMFLEYWRKPEATADKVRDGWLRTGDLARLRDDGQMVFHARDDDVITSAGYRIGPVEIEQALTSHPDIVMAAVVGAPDPVRTEIVVAHVVLREGAEWDGLPEAAAGAGAREGLGPLRAAPGDPCGKPADDGHGQDPSTGLARAT
jgi:acetyl-CoA synthetase